MAVRMNDCANRLNEFSPKNSQAFGNTMLWRIGNIKLQENYSAEFTHRKTEILKVVGNEN